jgi:hypothetical protein
MSHKVSNRHTSKHHAVKTYRGLEVSIKLHTFLTQVFLRVSASRDILRIVWRKRSHYRVHQSYQVKAPAAETFNAQWLLCIPPCLTIHKFPHCVHTVHLCVGYDYRNIQHLVSYTALPVGPSNGHSVVCEVRTEILDTI